MRQDVGAATEEYKWGMEQDQADARSSAHQSDASPASDETVFSLYDRVKIKCINAIPGFLTHLIGQEGTIEEQDFDDPDGLYYAVHIDNGPTLYFGNSEIEHIVQVALQKVGDR